ncbi:MAG TPA: valine--tRNA ligase [Acidobacteriota bacterium]|nr:valine--tRNA ligase [Acidobacteriota bacterium]
MSQEKTTEAGREQSPAQTNAQSDKTQAKYSAATDEPNLLTYWKTHKTFKFNQSSKKPVFSIDTPPPTMSGKMHIGHACSYSQQDFIARYKRMNGFEVLYPFGTDDNGLPTEKLVQKVKNVLATKMEREAFVKLVLDYLKEERPKFISDWQRIGISCDFDIMYSTIDPLCRRISQLSFLNLAKKGLVYQKEAPVIWDTVFQTAIAQAELVDVEKQSFFNNIVFKLESGENLIIATTRPELLGGCVAIFAHPEDKRYNHLFGKFAISPLYNAKVPIMPDEKVAIDKGTGIVMCCTFGDQTDIEWYKKYNLPLKMVIDRDGKMNEASGKYARLKIEDARKAIIDDLKAANLLIGQKPITHTVNVGERSGVAVEILNSKQWYVKYLDKKEDFLKYSEQLEWHPQHMKHRLDNWIKGLNWDWSISRQRKYGVPIPAWHGSDGKIYFADESQLPVDPLVDKPKNLPHGVTVTPETDVFDTWFTSASTPFIVKELLKGTPIHDKLIPFSIRPQGQDIINFWLFYTLIKTELTTHQLPWKKALISGYVLDPHGEKMSKSKGNTISPQEILKKHPADAMRFWAATGKLGEDMPYQEKDLVTGAKLINKLWNAGKFVWMFTQSWDGKKPNHIFTNDEWLLSELNATVQKTTDAFEEFEYARAKAASEDFFWTIFCDQYLESIKKIHYAPDQFPKGSLQSAQYTVHTAFVSALKLFAPILPFITEAVYTNFFDTKEGASIHTSQWPTQHEIKDKHAHENGAILQNFLSTARRYKADSNVALNTPMIINGIACDAQTAKLLLENKEIIIGTLCVERVDEDMFKASASPSFTVATKVPITVSCELKPVEKKL